MSDKKWDTLIHNGPLFPNEYYFCNSQIIVGNEKFFPNEFQEEILSYFVPFLDKEIIENKIFIKNYFNYLKTIIPKNIIKYDFPKDWNFDDLKEKIKIRKEFIKTNRDAAEIEKIKNLYGYAILNGEKQPIASFLIEPPGLFIGRGAHPQTGAVKFRVKPEDVNINATNKVQPPDGHKWKSCEENKSSMELCSYKMRTSTGMILRKRILFASTSIVKQSSDQKKFEKAKKLIENWGKIKTHIEKNISNKDRVIKQSAMVSYLIMNLGIRIGDEKGSDCADTVGASSLRKEHLTLIDNTLKLKFLGKDCVEFNGSIELPENITKELRVLLDKSNKNDMIFPNVSSHDITNFLTEVVSGVTAKVFRTAHGSSLLAKLLQESKIKSNMTLNEKVAIFNEANLQVAKKLNHQKNVGVKSKDKSLELKHKFEELKESIKLSNKSLASEIYKYNIKIEDLDKKSLSERDKLILKKFYKDKIGNYKSRIDKNKQKLKDFEMKLSFKEKTSNIALGTSKTNYCDPRIGISWCKKFDIQLEKVYNKSMQEKFSWALDVEENYFSKYKTI